MDIKTQVNSIQTNKWRIGGFLGAFLAIGAIFFVVPIFEKNFYTHLLLQCSFVLFVTPETPSKYSSYKLTIY